MDTYPIKRALLSVSNKEGIVEFARVLTSYNVELISSGGTRRVLEKAGLAVTAIEDVTGNPEAFDGRMKTLSFSISSSLLYRRGVESDEKQADELSIKPIDLVVCHLYPFEEVVQKKGELDELIENIDIGGPTMLRAAAKNYQSVLVCPHPRFYSELMEALENHEGATTLELRQKMALHTFRESARYDSLITRELESRFDDFHHSFFATTAKSKALRYGENPQQKAWLCSTKNDQGFGESLQGKALSYNNIWDADQAWRCARDLETFCENKELFGCVIVKHANPCGLAVSQSCLNALECAWACDPVSSFGSIICFTQEVDEEAAKWLSSKFVEIIMAPSFSSKAIEIFGKKKNLRLIKKSFTVAPNEMMIRSVDDGFLIQDEDHYPDENIEWVGKKEPENSDEQLCRFGIIAAKHLRSNAISLVKRVEGRPVLIGAGMGNPNRLVSIEQAFAKAREQGHDDFSEAVLVSDAFFPFADNIELAHGFGVKTFIQPGGSVKDQEVLDKVDELGLHMAFTKKRHFRH